MSNPHKIYVASSWRNKYQPNVVKYLREAKQEVYDFREPSDGEHGFAWSSIDPDWLKWNPEQFQDALRHPLAKKGFALDWNAMQWADMGLLVLPCGRSAHLEAGYFVGAKKPLWIFAPEIPEPELMYKMATGIGSSFWPLLQAMIP